MKIDTISLNFPENVKLNLGLISTAISSDVNITNVAVVHCETTTGISKGLNAGAWTIGLAKTGNEVGLNFAEVSALSQEELEPLIVKARLDLAKMGTHYVVDSIVEVPAIIEDINLQLARGERP